MTTKTAEMTPATLPLKSPRSRWGRPFLQLASVGRAFNWAIIEGVVDAANIAYRRRFLLEKYPQLDATLEPETSEDAPTEVDEKMSVLDEFDSAGGLLFDDRA